MFENRLFRFLLTFVLLNCVPITFQTRQVIIGESGTTLNATEGQTFDLKCTALVYTEEHYIIWYRRSGITGDETVIYRNGTLLTSDLGQEALAYSLPNDTEIQLTIWTTGLGQWLHLNGYKCQVINTNNSEILLPGGYINLNITYPPPPGYPLCASSGYYDDVIGETVTISCSSQPGNPDITLELCRDNVTITSKNIEFKNNIRFTEISLNHSFFLQPQDLEATYQCKVTWIDDVTACTVLKMPELINSSTPTTTALLTTDAIVETTKLWTTEDKTTTSQNTKVQTNISSTIPAVTDLQNVSASKTIRPTSKLISLQTGEEKTSVTIISSIKTDLTTLLSTTENKLHTSKTINVTTSEAETMAVENSTQLSSTLATNVTRETKPQELLSMKPTKESHKGSILKYFIGIAVLGFVGIIVLAIFGRICKKRVERRNSIRNYREMQVKNLDIKDDDSIPDQFCGKNNPAFDEEERNEFSTIETNRQEYTQMFAKSMQNTKSQQNKENVTTDNYTQMLPKPLRSNSKKQKTESFEMDVHLIVDNDIYKLLHDPMNESEQEITEINENNGENSEICLMAEDSNYKEESGDQFYEEGNESPKELNIRLTDNHVMEDSTEC